MKRSNRLVFVLGLMLAVVAFGAVLSVCAPRGTAAAAPVQRVVVVTAAEDLASGALVAAEQRAAASPDGPTDAETGQPIIFPGNRARLTGARA